MRALTASEIIHLWETAYRFHPIDQALSVLQQAMPGHTREQLAEMPLGQRDALLLSLRQVTFGDALPGKDNCPQCNETVEFALSCAALSADAPEPRRRRLVADGYDVTVRPLTSFDLGAAANASTLQAARSLLLQHCVKEVLYQGVTTPVQALPQSLQNSIAETALATDPHAEKVLELSCPTCKNEWQSLLDIGQIFWMEICAWAQRLLLEVHQLATAYGWTEDEILKLGPVRRATYLQMVAA